MGSVGSFNTLSVFQVEIFPKFCEKKELNLTHGRPPGDLRVSARDETLPAGGTGNVI